MDLRQVPVAAIKANDYNFNEMNDAQLKGLADEVKKRGFLMHHIVARQEGEEFVIIDGEHQWKAAQMAGLETVPVQVLNERGAEAIAETFRRNGLRGETNHVKLARSIQLMQVELVDADGKPPSNVKIGRMMKRSDKWVATALEYGQLADLAQGRENFPDEKAIAKMAETKMKEWLAFAKGSGPNPNGEDLQLSGEGQGSGDTQPKDEPTEEDKARKAVESVIKKLAKMSIEDRAQIAAAIKRIDREAKKAVSDKEAAEPGLPL